MASFHQPTVVVLRYRMKRDPEIFTVRVDTCEVRATPTAWNAKLEPVEWHIDLFLNSWLVFPVHDLTDWHEFAILSMADFNALEGEITHKEIE